MLEVCDILLVRGHTLKADAIRDLTADGAPYATSYNHVGIYAGNNQVYDALVADGITLHELNYNPYDVFRIQMTDLQKQKVLEYCNSKVGTKYGKIQMVEEAIVEIFHIPLTINMGNDEWCSTFIVHAIAIGAGILITRKPLAVPNDIGWSVITQPI